MARKKKSVILESDIVNELKNSVKDSHLNYVDALAEKLKKLANNGKTLKQWRDLVNRALNQSSGKRNGAVDYVRNAIAQYFSYTDWDDYITNMHPTLKNVSDKAISENIATHNNTSTSKELKPFLAELEYLYYTTYELRKGCHLADEALDKFSNEKDIVKYWTLFHNRIMEWEPVRNKLINISDTSKDIKIKQECLFGIFENYLNQLIRDKGNRYEEFKELRRAKGKYLDMIPGKETISKYHYFLARYIEAEWWVLPNEERYSGNYLLDEAIKEIETAIQYYLKKSSSGYSKKYDEPFWTYCHKAMLCKIRGKHSEYEKSLVLFKKIITKELNKKENILVKSLQTYAATYYLLKKDPVGLKRFLDTLIVRIKKRIKELNLQKDYEVDEVRSYSFHHIDMIFWRDSDKLIKNKFVGIMTDFQNKCPW